MRRFLWIIYIYFVMVVVLARAGSSACAQSGRTQTIARSGVSDVPGKSDAKYISFGTPVLNSAGKVAFIGSLQTGLGGVTTADDTGIWGPDSLGKLSLIAREGSGGVPGFGLGLANFGHFLSTNTTVVLSSAGKVAFRGSLQTGSGGVTTADDTGIWGPDSSGNLSLIAREGSGGVPDVAGASFDGFGNPLLNREGNVLFVTSIRNPLGVVAPDDSGIWGPDSAGNLSLIVREGTGGVPNLDGANFGGMSGIVTLNDRGMVAFYGSLRTGEAGVSTLNNAGIWGPDSSGNLSLIVRSGSLGVPGIPEASYEGFDNPDLNNAGKVAFRGFLRTGLEISTSNNEGIWGPDASGNLSLIAREGSGNVPGVAEASYASFGNPVLNSAGDVSFVGSLQAGSGGVTSSNGTGVWGPNPSGNLTLIAREGSGGVPGVAGASFFNLSGAHPSINGTGLVTFQAGLTGPGITFANGEGIWVGDGIELVQVVRRGESLAGSTVSSLNLPGDSGGEDGRATRINDFGQIAYWAGLTSGQGIFLWTPDLHWRGTADDGKWDSRTNFTLSLDPTHVHRVLLDSAASTKIEGPDADTTVASLQIGGGAGNAILRLVPGVTLATSGGTDVLAAGTLTGSGTVAGDVLIGTDGTLAPGDSAGPLYVSGNMTWAAGGHLHFEINDTLGSAGAVSGWDLLSIDGALSITANASSPFVIDLRSLALTNVEGNADNFEAGRDYSWLFASTSGGVSGFDPGSFHIDLTRFSNAYTGTFSVREQTGSLYLHYTAVPEPGSLTLAAMALAMLGLAYPFRSRPACAA